MKNATCLQSGEHDAKLPKLQVTFHKLLYEVDLSSKVMDFSPDNHKLKYWEQVIHAPNMFVFQKFFHWLEWQIINRPEDSTDKAKWSVITFRG